MQDRAGFDDRTTVLTGEPSREALRPKHARGSSRAAWTLHAVLFAATALTTAIAGSYWDGHWSEPGDLLRNPSVVRFGIPYAALLLAILLAHELGHYFACRRHGIPATLPFFIPGIPIVGTFGAVIRIRGPIPDRNALFDVAAAGPIAGFVVALPVLVAGLLRAMVVPGGFPEGTEGFGSPAVSQVFERLFHGSADLRVDSVFWAAWVGMLMTSLNLFPVGQLDGGHAAYAVSRRLHRILSRATLAALAALVVYQVVVVQCVPMYSLWLVILSVLRDRHPPVVDGYSELSAGRRLVALVLVLLLVLTFIPLPLQIRLDSVWP